MAGQSSERRWIGTSLLVAILVFATAYLAIELTREANRVAFLWFANGLLLGVVMRSHTRSWPTLFGSAYAANIAANLVTGDAIGLAALLSSCNSIEVLVAAVGLRRLGWSSDALMGVRWLTLFAIIAGGIAPLISAALAMLILSVMAGADPVAVAERWFLADSLGMLTLGSLTLAFAGRDRRPTKQLVRAAEGAALVALVAGVTAAVFAQSQYPLLFVIPALLVLVAFRTGLPGAAAAVFAVAIVAGVATIRGEGPVSLRVPDMAERVLFLQFFVAVCAVVALVVAAVLSERARLAASLAESERLHRLLADHSGDMIVRIGLDGVRRYISPACRKLLGFEPSEMIGNTPVAAIHAEDRARVIDVCQSLLSGAEEPICNYRQQHRDGHYIWLEASYRLVRDATGAPSEFVATVRDISRRAEAELAAAETGARLAEHHRLLLLAEATARLGHWRVDLIARTVHWSDAVCRIHGLASAVSLDPSDTIDLYHPDDRERVRDAFVNARQEGSDFVLDARVVQPTGLIRHVAIRGLAERAPNGEVVGLFGVIQDVTERAAAQAALAASEARYRTVVETTRDVIFQTDPSGRCIYLNPAWTEMTGHAVEQGLASKFIELLHPDNDPVLQAQRMRMMFGGADGFLHEVRYRHADASWRWAETRVRALRDSAGVFLGTSGTASDITARKEGEAALADRAAQLYQLATTDELTGLANRHHFLARLRQEHARTARDPSPLALAIFDVDHFKRVNDLHGHDGGDEALRVVARTAMAGLRDSDLVGRIGGEEFAVLMPRTDLNDAGVICERLRETIAGASIAMPNGFVTYATVSVGLAVLMDGEDVADLMRRADAALYEAKFEGRNCLKLAA